MIFNHGAYIVILAGLTIAPTYVNPWSYEHQELWPGFCKTGDAQSPLDLSPTSSDVHTFWPFHFSNYDGEHNATVTNNGHTVVINFLPDENENLPKLSGGGLPDEYTFKEIHFHWQSEHTLQGYRFPLEMHLVHYASKYESLDNALLYDNAITVLGVWFDASIDDDEFFFPVVNAVKQVQRALGYPVLVERPLRMSSFLPREHGGYFRYKGSLTTPKCNENVIWTVFSSTIPISQKQLMELGAIYTHTNDTVGGNYREAQPVNNRKVYFRKAVYGINSALSKSFSVGLLVSIISIIIFF